MSTTRLTTESTSPASLAAAVRRLARDARDWRLALAPEEAERLRLLARIDRLSLALDGSSHQPLRRWLENLRRDLAPIDAPALGA